MIPSWTRLSAALLEAELISPEEFRQRKEEGVERAKELVRQSTLLFWSAENVHQGKTNIGREMFSSEVLGLSNFLSGGVFLLLWREDVKRRWQMNVCDRYAVIVRIQYDLEMNSKYTPVTINL